MALTHLASEFKTLSVAAKLGIGALVLILLLIVAGSTRSCVSSYKDAQADKAIAAAQAESQQHRERADAAEAKAREDEARRKESEGKAALAEMAVQAAGKKAEAIAEKVKVEDAKLTEELNSVGDSIEPCERVRRICTRLRIPAKDCSCTSN
jgi:chemotaxis protein histidine kinase CheA